MRRDVLLLKRFFVILNPMDEVTMPAWINLGTLAIAAGWSLRARGMTILGMQVTDITMNKLVSTGDDLWGAEWDRIPDSLKVYSLGDLKLGHTAFIILMSILLRDLFPDPNVLLKHGDWTQHKGATWFAH